MSVAVIVVKSGSYLPFVLLTISILIGVPVAYRYYRDAREDDEPIRNADLLAELERGDAARMMTEAEFRRVRERLGGSDTELPANPPPKSIRAKPETSAASFKPEAATQSESPQVGEADTDVETQVDEKHERSE